MSDGGKGSKPRPFSVTQEEYDNRWNAIFGKDLNQYDESEQDKITRSNEETQEAKRVSQRDS